MVGLCLNLDSVFISAYLVGRVSFILSLVHVLVAEPVREKKGIHFPYLFSGHVDYLGNPLTMRTIYILHAFIKGMPRKHYIVSYHLTVESVTHFVSSS